MNEREPKIIKSHLSRTFVWHGYHLQIEIYRLNDRPGWQLEVVNENGTSICWDGLFDTDRDADSAFRAVLAEEGIAAFLDDDEPFPFSRTLH